MTRETLQMTCLNNAALCSPSKFPVCTPLLFLPLGIQAGTKWKVFLFIFCGRFEKWRQQCKHI